MALVTSDCGTNMLPWHHKALIISSLQHLNLIRYYEGQHIIDISNLPERLRCGQPHKHGL